MSSCPDPDCHDDCDYHPETDDYDDRHEAHRQTGSNLCVCGHPVDDDTHHIATTVDDGSRMVAVTHHTAAGTPYTGHVIERDEEK